MVHVALVSYFLYNLRIMRTCLLINLTLNSCNVKYNLYILITYILYIMGKTVLKVMVNNLINIKKGNNYLSLQIIELVNDCCLVDN